MMRRFQRLAFWGYLFITSAAMSFADTVATPPTQYSVNWQRLPLTPAQQTAIKRHDQLWQRAFEQLYPEIIADRKHLSQLLLSKETDTEAIFQTLKRLEDKEQELRYEAVKNFLLKKQELTPAQQAQLHQQGQVH
jgi:Spy/CpxP family protein refolding chaperone